LSAAFDEQYESIPDDEIVLVVRKFRASHKFCKERRRSPRGCFECGDTIHFIVNYLKKKKVHSSSNKYDYTKWNDYNKGDDKKKCRFEDKKKNKKFQKMMSRACAAISDLDFSSDNSSSSEEDENPKCKKDDFTGLYLMGKSS
jgi:CRISPR/Cas system-associated endonuclease/helicase Cas3